MENLQSIWKDIVTRKMYVTGACGALYDGTSPDGTATSPTAYRRYTKATVVQTLTPNSTAHNETCANIGNMLFNLCMLQTTGEAKYAEIVETCLYNSVLSGVSRTASATSTNLLRISNDLPYTLRCSKERMEYISCFCCPPNTLCTVCQAQNYAYTVSKEGIWCNLYGGSELETAFTDGSKKLTQVTDYSRGMVPCCSASNKLPKKKAFSLYLRVPEWHHATLKVNGGGRENQSHSR